MYIGIKYKRKIGKKFLLNQMKLIEEGNTEIGMGKGQGMWKFYLLGTEVGGNFNFHAARTVNSTVFGRPF